MSTAAQAVPTIEDIEIMTEESDDVNAIRKVSTVVVRPKTTYSVDDESSATGADEIISASIDDDTTANIADDDDEDTSANGGDDVLPNDGTTPDDGDLFALFPEVASCRERFDKFRRLVEEDLEAKLCRLQDYRRRCALGHSLRDRNYANIQIFMLNKYAWRLRRFEVICNGELTHLETTFRAGNNNDDVRSEVDHYIRLGEFLSFLALCWFLRLFQ